MSLDLIPKHLNIKCSLTVVHDHLLGWDRLTGTWLNDSTDMKCFPYGLNIEDDEDIKESMKMANGSDSPAGDYYDTTFGDAHGGMPQTDREVYETFDEDSASTLFSQGIGSKGLSYPVESQYANATEYFITIVHITTGSRLHFKAFLTSLTDNFSVRWDSQNLHGRMDAAKSFQGTQRSVSLSWDLVAANVEEGIENLRKCTNFIRMLYPTYTMHGSAASIKSPPMMAVKFANLVSQGEIGSNRGLTGTLNGFTFSPNFDTGFFEVAKL